MTAELKEIYIKDREEQLEEALLAMLGIIDGREFNNAQIMAMVRGWQCDPDISKKNGEAIDQAYELLGKKRPSNKD